MSEIEDFDLTPLASLSLTHVHYDPTDPVSYVCAWLALVPQGLCVVYATLIWSTREVEIALMFLGQLGCEALNFILKRLIKQERPPRTIDKGYGMPSSHAQFVAYFAVSLALFLLFRHRPEPAPAATGQDGRRRRNNNHSSGLTRVERVGFSVLGLVVAAVVAWSRIYLHYHNEKQVLVGAAAGVVSALGWFIVTTVIRRTGLLAWAMDLPIARYFRVRDLVVEEDLCQAGWEKWDDRRTALRLSEKKDR